MSLTGTRSLLSFHETTQGHSQRFVKPVAGSRGFLSVTTRLGQRVFVPEERGDAGGTRRYLGFFAGSGDAVLFRTVLLRATRPVALWRRSHGTVGRYEFYAEACGSEGPEIVVGFMRMVAAKDPKGHWQCYRGSGLRNAAGVFTGSSLKKLLTTRLINWRRMFGDTGQPAPKKRSKLLLLPESLSPGTAPTHLFPLGPIYIKRLNSRSVDAHECPMGC